MGSVSLKLFVDKEKNRVMFAEAEKDLVDILLSFLTLPMGTIIRLLNKQSSIKCMDKLYESVENLDVKFFETEACKMLLLQPRSAAERLCEDLLVIVDDLKPHRLYSCPAFDCFSKTNRLYSSICGARCPCGKSMDKNFQWERTNNDVKDGVFMKGATTYIISDDLCIAPAASVMATLSLLRKFGITDPDTLEMRTVDVRRDEVLGLLKRLLLSKTPLTDVFMQKPNSGDDVTDEFVKNAEIKLEGEMNSTVDEAKTVSAKILENKITGKVVSAEAGNDFADVLFSFLTFPLGSIVKLLNKHSSVGCAENLYNSIEVLSTGNDCIKSTKSKNMLLSPKLNPHFNCSNQILDIEANLSVGCTALGCETCWNAGIKIGESTMCKHNIDVVTIAEMNPKLSNSGKESGGGYVKSSVRFMVTDEMVITPVSPTSAINVIKQLKVPISSLVEKEVKLGEAEVLRLLKACLISPGALSHVFSPAKKQRKLF